MAVERQIFKIRHYLCQNCHTGRSELRWDYDVVRCQNPPCEGYEMVETHSAVSAAPAVHGDEIDWTIRHGVCNDDGSPKRFRSRQEWKEACVEAGWTPMGDTPKPKSERNRWY